MTRLVLALDARTEERLLPALVERGHQIAGRLTGWRELLDRLDALGPEVLLVGAGRSTLTAELVAACDERGVRVVALAPSDADRANASAIGLHEVLDAGAPAEEVDALIRGGVLVPARIGEPAAPVRTSEIIAVWGPAGAPGRTTISINVAAELAALGHTVALVDSDPYGGSIAPALGLLDEAPGFASACRLAGSDALDRNELERIAQRYSSPRGSFAVLTGLIGPQRWPELGDERVDAALTMMRGWAEYIVVDTGFSLERDEELTSDQFAPRRNAATLAALRAADRVIALGAADPIGLSRFLRGHAELVETVDAERIDVIVNRVRTRVLGIDAHAQVRQTLRRFGGIETATLLPDDARSADAALLAARTLRDAAAKSPLRAELRSYVESAIVPVPEPRRRFGRSRATARTA
ncbi:AAA family ATPase [Agromyces archimandritae]|uniref:Regulator n=1 Tax=Agromyces archimandritae TaxID=2781962 RepID=A0A975FMK0_9MICO|nr:regulator [Agromyces archimandritae]QTX05223.1 regulator [Agromyces archimandritae]